MNAKRVDEERSRKQINTDVRLMTTDRRGLRSSALFLVAPGFTEIREEPRVHRALASGLASILTSLTAITNFPRRGETAVGGASTPPTTEASTSSGPAAHKSILRERAAELEDVSGKLKRFRQLCWWYPASKRNDKSIVFVGEESRSSDSSSNESIVTLIGAKPLKSALRSNCGSIKSGNSSVRFSLPEDTRLEDGNVTSVRIGKWEIVCRLEDEEDETEGWIATWRSLRRTRLCKIVICLALGVILPSLLVVPVLVYHENPVGTSTPRARHRTQTIF